MSPEALVLDDEIAGYFLRFQRGFRVDEESMALPTIKEVGLSGDFLSSPHTLQHFRQVLSRTQRAFRGRRADWEAKGSRTLEESAEERVREILAAEPRCYLDAHQEAELKRIEESAQAASG
jgi:trimethylamine:corrinoid methyltransferase-like protein